MPSILLLSATALPAQSHDPSPRAPAAAVRHLRAAAAGNSARSARNGGAKHGSLLPAGTPSPHIPGSGGMLSAEPGRAGGRARADSHHVTQLSPRATCGRQRRRHPALQPSLTQRLWSAPPGRGSARKGNEEPPAVPARCCLCGATPTSRPVPLPLPRTNKERTVVLGEGSLILHGKKRGYARQLDGYGREKN